MSFSKWIFTHFKKASPNTILKRDLCIFFILEQMADKLYSNLNVFIFSNEIFLEYVLLQAKKINLAGEESFLFPSLIIETSLICWDHWGTWFMIQLDFTEFVFFLNIEPNFNVTFLLITALSSVFEVFALVFQINFSPWDTSIMKWSSFNTSMRLDALRNNRDIVVNILHLLMWYFWELNVCPLANASQAKEGCTLIFC